MKPIEDWLIKSQFPPLALSTAARADLIDDALRFARKMRRLAPWHVRSGLLVLELAFAVVLLLTGLGAAPESARGQRTIALFASLPGPCAALVRFYATMTALSVFEQPIVLRLLGAPSPEDRQQEMRKRRDVTLAGGMR